MALKSMRVKTQALLKITFVEQNCYKVQLLSKPFWVEQHKSVTEPSRFSSLFRQEIQTLRVKPLYMYICQKANKSFSFSLLSVMTPL